jgi:prepilin-type N-terminal cleavage/methylation domain-containing protein
LPNFILPWQKPENQNTPNTMKLNTRNVTKKSGMTLLELTVVILVLLSLMTILFIGARSWKKGSDRAGCIMNIRNIHQAVRGDQNMKGKNAGDAGLVAARIIGAGGYIETSPTCPSTGVAFALADGNYPALNTAAVACPSIATETDHVPNSVTGW